jgi:MoxR-like ATPase
MRQGTRGGDEMKTLTAQGRSSHYDRLELEGKPVWIPRPVEFPRLNLVKRDELLNRAMAAWLRIDGLPSLNFRLYGPPGSGKNALVYQLAKSLKRDLSLVSQRSFSNLV